MSSQDCKGVIVHTLKQGTEHGYWDEWFNSFLPFKGLPSMKRKPLKTGVIQFFRYDIREINRRMGK